MFISPQLSTLSPHHSPLLARATTPEQQAAVGHQTGGRVFLFLSTDDFWRDYHAMVARGVKFVRPPKAADYGWGAVFEDLYGNLWDLVQLNTPSETKPGSALLSD